MAHTVQTSALQTHYDRDKPSSIRFDAYQNASQLSKTTLITGRSTGSFLANPLNLDTSQPPRKRSRSCHPRFHTAVSLDQLVNTPSGNQATATANTASLKRTQQWLNRVEETDVWHCTIGDETTVIVEDVEPSSDEEEVSTTPLRARSINGRRYMEFGHETASETRASTFPVSLGSRTSSTFESDSGDRALGRGMFARPFGTSQALASKCTVTQMSLFHPVVEQVRQSSSAGSSTLLDSDGFIDNNSVHPTNMCNPEEDAWSSNHSEESLDIARLQDPVRHVRRSLSVPRHPTNSQNDEHPASSRRTVRSHSRHQSTRFRTYGPRHTPQHYIALSKEPLPVFDIYTDGIKQLSELLDHGAISSTGIVDTYLRQIDKHNDTLRALVHLAPREEIYRLARRRDLERRLGRCRGPLHGIPLVIKDNIATEESMGMPTTAGSFALMGMPVKKDSFIVTKLREAGAIIIAKANMSELADYKSRHAGPGWSAVGGQTLNVYAAHASPGTSSAGNGVAVAAGFCPASIGTETDGSITLPCLQSALYGLKPTVGLLSRTGIVPFAPYFDTAGPMTKNVWDLALLMDVMHGDDPEDPISLTVERPPHSMKYIHSVAEPSFKGFRIGVPRENWHNVDPWKRPGRDLISTEISDAFELALSTMSGLGATITDPADIPSVVDGSLWKCAEGSRSLVVAADCKEYLGRYLQNLGGEGGCRSVEHIIAFNKANADIEMPPGHHGQEVLERTLFAKSVQSPEYLSAKQDMVTTAGTRGLDAVFEEHNLDAIFMIREGHHSLANMVGYPIGTIPLSLMSDGVPIGAFFIGKKHGEATLLAIMSAWEAGSPYRPVPPIAGH